MSLKNKLDNLLKQAGQAPKASPPPQDSPAAQTSVAERIQRARAQAHVPRTPSTKMSDEALAQQLGGSCLAPGVLLLERRLSLQERHGAHVLAQLVAKPRALPEAEPHALEQLVFMDTETTGLAGGSGTLVFLLGLARVQGDQLVCRQYLLTTFAGETAMLNAAADWLVDTRAMVTFNGKSFDAPLLTTRARLAGAADVFSNLHHIDLLHPTRRAFGFRWPDCRLATVEKELLRFVRTDDLPGSEAPATWFEWVHLGRAERLPDVAEHNYWDLVSLAALLPLLGEIQHDPDTWHADVLAFARAHIKQERFEKAIYLLEKCRASLDEKGLLELAWLYRRKDEWTTAKAIWEPLAEQGSTEAREWLAKYYEHVVKDIQQALAYAYALPDRDSHRHRRERLEARLARAG